MTQATPRHVSCYLHMSVACLESHMSVACLESHMSVACLESRYLFPPVLVRVAECETTKESISESIVMLALRASG